MKAAIKVLRGAITVLLLVTVGINLWMAVQQTVLKKDPPEFLGYSQLAVTSGSMEPTLAAGDMIIIQEKESYTLGDVVTFRDSSGTLVTHRIVGSTDGMFITQGDANNVEDQDLLSPESIVGGVITYIPAVGRVMLFLRTPAGLLLLLVVGILLIELPRLAGTLRKQGRGRHIREEP